MHGLRVRVALGGRVGRVSRSWKSVKEIGEEDAARRGIGPSLVGQAATNSASVVELARCGATRCAGYVATNLRAPSLFAEMLGDALPRGTHRVIRGTDNSPRVPFLSIVRTRDFVHTRLLTFSSFFFFFFFFFCIYRV